MVAVWTACGWARPTSFVRDLWPTSSIAASDRGTAASADASHHCDYLLDIFGFGPSLAVFRRVAVGRNLNLPRTDCNRRLRQSSAAELLRMMRQFHPTIRARFPLGGRMGTDDYPCLKHSRDFFIATHKDYWTPFLDTSSYISVRIPHNRSLTQRHWHFSELPLHSIKVGRPVRLQTSVVSRHPRPLPFPQILPRRA